MTCGESAVIPSRSHRFEQTADDLVGIDAIGLSLKIHQQTVTKYRECDRMHVFERGYRAPIEERRGLCAEYE
jgi:hypothetical protein